jgi:hypothetical protein
VVDEAAGACSSQVLSEPDFCGFFIQESKISPKNDIAAILFAGVDQLDNIDQVSKMVGPRPLILFNKQLQRPADFEFGKKDNCNQIVFDQFSWGFAFQEYACRGEDMKLTFEYPNWQSCVICDENQELGQQEIALLSPQPDRPSYDALEKKINVRSPARATLDAQNGRGPREGIKIPKRPETI